MGYMIIYPLRKSAAAVSTPIVIFMLIPDLLSSKIPSMGSMFYRTMILEESADMEIMVMVLLTFLLFFVCTAIVRKSFKKR